jgi:hypothetical protein
MTDDLVERVVDVILMVFEGADVTETAKGVIAIALEEAAKVADFNKAAMEDAEFFEPDYSAGYTAACFGCAAAIRAKIKETK